MNVAEVRTLCYFVRADGRKAVVPGAPQHPLRVQYRCQASLQTAFRKGILDDAPIHSDAKTFDFTTVAIVEDAPKPAHCGCCGRLARPAGAAGWRGRQSVTWRCRAAALARNRASCAAVAGTIVAAPRSCR
ncbi:MAG: hypothetical protein KGL39_19910 [Patescibacteria group bacterium]|nr:hypothetical protein [Patescibacteria group bacterium]